MSSSKNLITWFPNYIKNRLKQLLIFPKKPIDIMFCYVDHFEPEWNDADESKEQERLKRWDKYYPILSKKHKDSDGICPQHTWFYPAERRLENLDIISSWCFNGLGDLELHLHHGNDTSETLQKKMSGYLTRFNDYGALLTATDPPETKYAFIHGNWALDNSAGDPTLCGVNDEISILSDTGCYADLTMPSLGPSQASKVNAIYYVKDDPYFPKSYNTGVDVTVGGSQYGDLMMITGPIGINWKDWHHWFYPAVENSDISTNRLPSDDRVRLWVKTGIHVKKKPEWIFVKVHTHGTIEKDFDTVLGESADRMHSTLEKEFNDGSNYRLHYVTARECYNIIKAAEAGKTGNPCDYRDFIIPPYVCNVLKYNPGMQLIYYRKDGFKIKTDKVINMEIQTRKFSLQKISGSGKGIEYFEDKDMLKFRLDSVKSGSSIQLWFGNIQSLEPDETNREITLKDGVMVFKTIDDQWFSFRKV
ncbi:MAG: hypothetical protein ABIK15_15610 [Pseudomonadota bacterium]